MAHYLRHFGYYVMDDRPLENIGSGFTAEYRDGGSGFPVPIRDAGDPGRALTMARSVLAFKKRIDRSMLGEALALTVRLTASRDPGQPSGRAERELVSGLVDGFDPDLFGITQELTPRTIDVLAEDLGLARPADAVRP